MKYFKSIVLSILIIVFKCNNKCHVRKDLYVAFQFLLLYSLKELNYEAGLRDAKGLSILIIVFTGAPHPPLPVHHRELSILIIVFIWVLWATGLTISTLPFNSYYCIPPSCYCQVWVLSILLSILIIVFTAVFSLINLALSVVPFNSYYCIQFFILYS